MTPSMVLIVNISMILSRSFGIRISWNGQRLGIPISRNANFLVQNISWSKELGFDIPAMTPQFFRTQTCKARDELLNDNDWMNNGMGGWIVTQDEYTILSWLNAFQLVEFPTSETPYAFDQPATLDGFHLFTRDF